MTATFTMARLCSAARLLDGATGSRIGRRHRLEEGQDVLGAGCRPPRQETVVRIGERASTPDRDEARVTYAGENHEGTCAWSDVPTARVQLRGAGLELSLGWRAARTHQLQRR